MNLKNLETARQHSLDLTKGGVPVRTQNQFFGVGPITDMTSDEVDARRLRKEFERWLEDTYPKCDDKGNVIGNFTAAELGRGMHRGYPADKVLHDMMAEIHRYFGFQDNTKIAVGLGGGHSGFTVAALHLVSANKPDQHIFVDTPKPESEIAKKSGFFRQSWGAQLIEMLKYSKNGAVERLHFADDEGNIPPAETLNDMGVKLFFGVGHETTGATTYTQDEINNLLTWIDSNPEENHAVIDATSMLGAMPWDDDVVAQVLSKCCMFTPFQKAIGGVSGYFIFSMTEAARAMIDDNMKDPSWAIPRQLKIAVPVDPKMPLSSKITTSLGPVYDPANKAMMGGIINTFSTLAFAETTFAILHNEKSIGDVKTLNQRSMENRQFISDWVEANPLFELGVKNPQSRGAAVTLLKVTDDDITDTDMHVRIIAESKKMLGYEGLTHPNGDHEKGLDVARYVNAFPGTDGDFRAWMGGIRAGSDIKALMENIEYCYHRAKILVLEQELEKEGKTFASSVTGSSEKVRCDDQGRAYKILIADLVGMRFDDNGKPDFAEVKAHIEARGGGFHVGSQKDVENLEEGKLHFFYEPSLSTQDELLAATVKAQYDAVIAAATFLPANSRFEFGGVRMGAGTGNMGSDSWGGGNGTGGTAALMNTPSFNSCTTAQTAIKALLKVMPDLQVEEMHQRVVDGNFDTGKNLVEYPTTKIECKTIAIIGYGNIGREVAKLAKALGMKVIIFARPRHKEWILSEGFDYAETIIQAVSGADVISPHVGLGPLDVKTGFFSNEKLIDAEVLAVMNRGAVVVNYDRGELVCTKSLDEALASGQVSYAAIDADLFKDAATGELSGPMVPYLEIYPKHIGKMELLPHVAADTEHVSRVDAAKQAVDQIYDLIQFKVVINLKGDLPEGYSDGKSLTVNGVGAVTKKDISGLSADSLENIRNLTENLATFWGALEATKDADRRAELIERYASDATKTANRLLTVFDKNGLQGPFYD
ncbi:MAG: phosphoglycerate dehydrogenase [Rhodospirillales bacterium]|nr:phosphoglycerate dehydrogenase [Rhodospirillales bacterium]